MKSRNLLFVAVAGVLAGWLPQAGAQDQKHVVLSNVDSVAGQAAIGGKAAIPLTGSAQVDAQGNIVVSCDLGNQAPSGECSNLGAGSSGTLTAPSITFNGPTDTVAANDTTARLHWTTSNAQTCYGLAPTLTGWNKEWAGSTGASTGFQVGNLPRHATDPTVHNFTLRCYSNTVGTLGSTPIVAYTDTSHAVTLAPSVGSTPSGNCATYLEGLSQTERDHFDAYNADNRGFTAQEMTFQAKTTRIPGQHSGVTGVMLPGKLSNEQYLALSFTLPAAGGANTGRFTLDTQTGTGFSHPIIITISPCKGDFRPRNSSSEHYTSNFCRTVYDSSGRRVSSAVPGEGDTGWCNIPVGQTMYMNIAKRNLYTAPGSTIPAATCLPTVECGAGSLMGK